MSSYYLGNQIPFTLLGEGINLPSYQSLVPKRFLSIMEPMFNNIPWFCIKHWWRVKESHLRSPLRRQIYSLPRPSNGITLPNRWIDSELNGHHGYASLFVARALWSYLAVTTISPSIHNLVTPTRFELV